MTLGITINIPPTRRLGSNWDHLNDSLLAHFRPVDYDGQFLADDFEVVAPVVEANMSSQFNWQSPFEQMGPESKAPAIAAMIQSGAFLPLVSALQHRFIGTADDSDNSLTKSLKQSAASLIDNAGASLQQLRGRTGVTKLNSMQIFTGLPPLKISMSVVFRAWSDPIKEVMQPYAKLMQWAHPQKLAEDSILAGILVRNSESGGILGDLLPSVSPQLLYLRFGQLVFQKMVIESIDMPLSSPRDRNGNYTELLVNMTIASLQALDKQDVSDLIGQ